MFLGIDPGIKNLGIAIIKPYGELILSGRMNFNENETMTEFIDRIICTLIDEELGEPIKEANIERFVSYGNVQTKDTERITMLIGGLVYALNSIEIPTYLHRAIDWKPALCKHLVKYNEFDNPSTKFDKQFDFAAAKTITGTTLSTDHEADAVCLAYMWNVKRARSEGMVGITKL